MDSDHREQEVSEVLGRRSVMQVDCIYYGGGVLPDLPALLKYLSLSVKISVRKRKYNYN